MTEMKNKTIIKHWMGLKPDVVSKKKKNDELQLVVDWKIGNPTDVVIKRISEKSFSYEDVGCFRREFPNVERLLWEYELPISIKEDIISLPISQSVEETFFDWEKYEESIQTKHNKKVMERIGGLI